MKTVLITGVGRGIGRALAEKFLAENWQVFGTSQSGTVDYTHPNLKVLKLDLTSTELIENCSKELMTNGAKIDILVNNAGINGDRGTTRLNVEKLRKNLEVNLIGTSDFTGRLVEYLINSSGHIVFISSAAGSISDMDHIDHSHAPYKYPGYKISKAAQNMYARTLAARLRHENSSIIVSSVHPGWVRTDMGGEDAPISPAEAAEDIYKLAISRPETGQFWFKRKKYPW